MEGEPRTVMPSSARSGGDKNVLHRAIYDHFRRLASSFNKQILVPLPLMGQDNNDHGRGDQATVVDVSDAINGHNNQSSDETVAQMRGIGTTTGKVATGAAGAGAYLEEGDSKRNFSLSGAQEEIVGDHLKREARHTTMHMTIPTALVDEMALSEKHNRVLNVLEREFPEIMHLPGESLADRSISELELRFTAYPRLQRQVDACPPHHQHPPLPLPPPPLDTMQPPGPTQPAPLNPHPPQFAAHQSPQTHPHNTANIAIDMADSAAGVAIPPPMDGNAEAINITDSNSGKKRKIPPSSSTVNDQDNLNFNNSRVMEPNSKKIKEQETEIKKMKTQLKRAKDKIQQLSSQVNKSRESHHHHQKAPGGGVLNNHRHHHEDQVLLAQQAMAEKKEKAMAAAVPFDQRYQELVHFQRGHGHTRVPCTSKENPGLARWVQTLRAAKKEKEKRGNRYYGQLTDARQKQLESIGFEWSIQAPKATWEQRFEELKAYKEEHGHCRVVRSYSKNPSLGEWCHRQRFLAHKHQLDDHKVKQLTDLGFEIWVRKQGKSWEDHFEKLLDFRRKHQHMNVPTPDTRTKVKLVLSTASAGTTNSTVVEPGKLVEGEGEQSEWENPALGKALEDAELGPANLDPATEEYKEEQAFRRWVVAQRDNYHLKYKRGIKSTLNNARVKKLESVGFDFTREGGENDLRKLRRGELHHRNDPNIWKRRFDEVVEYKKRFGDCNIPKEWSENKQLGAWVSTQRKMYKALLAGERSSLTPERRSALESIGFTWILRPARTRPKILEIEGLQRNEMNDRGLY